MANLSFEGFRRQVLKELSKKQYRNFQTTTKAFTEVNGLDYLAESLMPMLKSLWKEKWTIEASAVKIDELTSKVLMAGMLLVAEQRFDKRG